MSTSHSGQPDILEVIANLSSNEVFTPPRIANAVLDLLPADVWKDKTLRWLDPGSKTGVFPREITRRLMTGLEKAIPDEAERLRHIQVEMVHAIAITDMTAKMSRRSLYCSKDATSEASATRFESSNGNVWFSRVEHVFNKEGRCVECGGIKHQLERKNRDNFAYGFIHEKGRDKIEKGFQSMKFDVVIGNPPYQMETGGESRQAVPIYQKFIDEAKRLNPRYISMIIPSRWFAGGLGLDAFRREMLTDRRIRRLVDYLDVRDCFPGVDLAGGVCYFLWDRDNPGSCEVENRWASKSWKSTRLLDEFDVLVRLEPAVQVLRQVQHLKEEPITSQVSGVRPFGLATGDRPDTRGELKLMSSGGNGPLRASRVTAGHEMIKKWKVVTSKASHDHGGQPDKDGKRRVLSTMEVLGPDWVCTESYIVLGCFKTKREAENCMGYFQTCFARFLISLRSMSQDITRDRFAFVPTQDFSRSWTDQDLYEKYELTIEHQEVIRDLIKEWPQ
jgi:site-specific DNA-methyltransferase (adenine-specific)